MCLTSKLHCVICEHSDYETSVPDKIGISVSNSSKTITVNLMPGHIRNMARAAVMNWEHDHHELSSDTTMVAGHIDKICEASLLPDHVCDVFC